MRSIFTILLEILPQTPVTHGSGSEGNEQVLARQTVMLSRLHPTTGKTQAIREEIPYVSGGSLRAKLRLSSLLRQAERQNLPDGCMSKDALRLILKGGRLDGAGKGPNLDEIRRITELFPSLRLFGAMDNRLKMTGALKVEDVRPFCAELISAGHIPATFGGTAIWGGDPADPTWPRYDAPPSFTDIVDVRTYYRHDMGVSPALPMLAAEERAQIEDQQAAVATKRQTKGAPKPDKEERREANESMPYGFQHIIPGTPLYTCLRTDPITEIEACALADALHRWIDTGGHIGGGESKGHGRCRVRVAGTWERSASSAVTGTEISLTDRWKAAEAAYNAHLETHRPAVMDFLRESW
jgi:hypothetical protein